MRGDRSLSAKGSLVTLTLASTVENRKDRKSGSFRTVIGIVCNCIGRTFDKRTSQIDLMGGHTSLLSNMNKSVSNVFHVRRSSPVEIQIRRCRNRVQKIHVRQ
jgi:hypothetical protein